MIIQSSPVVYIFYNNNKGQGLQPRLITCITASTFGVDRKACFTLSPSGAFVHFLFTFSL